MIEGLFSFTFLLKNYYAYQFIFTNLFNYLGYKFQENLASMFLLKVLIPFFIFYFIIVLYFQ